MVIKPKVRGFICTNSHPVGCAASVQQQINYVKQQETLADGPKNVLILGCSTGYGLSSRIVSAFGYGAKTLGVCFEKPPSERKTATAGWYNTAAFHQQAKDAGLYAHTLNGDAFSNELKQQVIDELKANVGKVDLIIYSLASPRRTDPATGEVFKSILKPVGAPYTTKNYDTDKDLVHEIALDAASEDEISDTIKVMGGEDWELWLSALNDADLLAQGCKTAAYTYIGKELTWPIYGKATIGKAKEDLDRAASAINSAYAGKDIGAYVTSLKAVVTQASSAIPVMPLYISLMYKVMKEDNSHEGCIEQIVGLFSRKLTVSEPETDEQGRLRMDGVETNDETQAKIKLLWDKVTQENFHELSDYAGYHHDFLQLFGFDISEVDYNQDVDTIIGW